MINLLDVTVVVDNCLVFDSIKYVKVELKGKSLRVEVVFNTLWNLVVEYLFDDGIPKDVEDGFNARLLMSLNKSLKSVGNVVMTKKNFIERVDFSINDAIVLAGDIYNDRKTVKYKLLSVSGLYVGGLYGEDI